MKTLKSKVYKLSELERKRMKSYRNTEAGKIVRKRQRNTRFLKKYKITLSEYEDLSKNQSGLCAICKKICISGRRLSVDHNHETSKVRGLLCMKCNRGLGLFNDNILLLESAINYLKQ